MRGYASEYHVVADYHGAAGEILQRLFIARSVSTSSVGGSSSSKHIGAELSILARCTRVAFARLNEADLLSADLRRLN